VKVTIAKVNGRKYIDVGDLICCLLRNEPDSWLISELERIKNEGEAAELHSHEVDNGIKGQS